MTQSEPSASSPPASAPKSRLRRWMVRLSRAAVIGYVAACLVVYLIQNWIIFPGAYFHGRESAIVLADSAREIISLRAPDGHQIAATFGAALDADGRPRADAAHCPTMLFFYGNGDCMKTSLGIIDSFRRLGCNVLCPEYVGYPMSGGRPSEAGMYATANAAWAYLQTRPDVDRHQIILVGRSLGCAAAIDLAAREPAEGLVTFSAFTSMDEMARKVMPIFPTGLFLKCHLRNQDKIGQVKCPIFMAHGTQDAFVPYSMMARLAASAKMPVTVYPIQGADHNNIFLLGGGIMLEKLDQFVQSLHPVE